MQVNKKFTLKIRHKILAWFISDIISVIFASGTIHHLMFSMTDVGGQHCPCPVRVSFLSGFSGKSCPVSVRCPDSVRIFCQVSVCPDSVCLDSVRCPDSVRIFGKQAVRCLSVRVLSVSILSAVWILSGFLEKMLSGVCLSGFFLSWSCPLSVCPVPV